MIARSTTISLVVTVAALTAAGPAAAHKDAPRTARTVVTWTPAQLQALAGAYSAKNPGWAPPNASGARTPAQMTWTKQNLDALAQAYAERNPN